MAELKDKIAALESRVADNPAAMLDLAHKLEQDGQREKALALCCAAVSLMPDDAELSARAKRLVAATVPRWHFSIVRDAARNAAYDAALRRAVKAGSRVLEIGTGTGLLAMMAARAGAAEVLTCEMNPAIAAKAAEIVALNGYADRVRVVAKHSDRLEVEADMGGRADILVSELVGNDLLGQNVLLVHERAVRDLLKPRAHVIPARGAVRVALAHETGGLSSLTNIGGFDLSAFNTLRQSVPIPVGEKRLSLRSEAADLFIFDFASAHYCAPSQASLVCRSAGGPVNGIAQWLVLELDEVTRYENRPALGANSCWSVMLHPFAQTIDTVAGQEFQVFGSHDRRNVAIWTEANST